MCGFVGYLTLDGRSEPDLEQWSDCIRHRGPDQSGTATSNDFGIGTRRLSIQDLSSAGDQPMRSNRYILGFNGEIYNHQELRTDLLSEGATQFISNSDTETVLRAIEHWGIPETLERLNGMYAIAIWDELTQELSLVRDPLGVKPIYYIRNDAGLFFGSEIKALRPFSVGKISQEGVALYLYFGFVPAPFSLLEGVKKIRPGERLICNLNGARSEFVVPQTWKQPAQLAPTWIERVEQVRTQVENAVTRQLVSDVPVGVFLSGGIDSTIIAGIAAQSGRELASFSLNPMGAEQDPLAQNDAQLASALAENLGLLHHEVPFYPEDVMDRLGSMLHQIDEPVAEFYALGELVLSEKAREEGVEVVLTGHGGDEVFLGYPTYRAVFRGDLYNKIPMFGPVAQLAARASAIPADVRTNLAGAARIWRKAPLDRYATVSGVHFSLDDVASLSGLSCEHLSDLISGVLEDTASSVMLLPRASGSCNAELFARMDMLLMVPDHYNTRLDRMSMSASVEARVPLQDIDLVGFVSHLPHDDLLRGGLKGMLRHAFKDTLPSAIADRPKQTFQAPMLSWVTGPLSPWVREQIVKLPQQTLVSQSLTEMAQTSTRQAYQAWSLALLEGWRHALDLEY